jgi:hypothetical protein
MAAAGGAVKVVAGRLEGEAHHALHAVKGEVGLGCGALNSDEGATPLDKGVGHEEGSAIACACGVCGGVVRHLLKIRVHSHVCHWPFSPLAVFATNPTSNPKI